MEGIKVIIFVLVGVVWLAIWIIRMFMKAFDQPAATNKKPFEPKQHTSLEEMLRQHLPKTEAEILERAEPGTVKKMTVEKLKKRSLESDKPKYRTLDSLEPRRRSLETLEPMGTSLDNYTGEVVAQREDIVRQRSEKNVYQKNQKKPVSRYAAILHNPQSARDAIVLSEILKPKF
ncbi:MAG TPA: hypothetical protein VK927_05935 [Adhaeribacter sp.]|nr:hypothetical protein [Adhaeribacter sp.]